MLAGALLFHADMSLPVYAVEGESREVDVYSLDIEFGSLSFYYDYGIWNVNTMRYEAGQNSVDPANGTVLGFPGWYGFDGTANKIVLKNGSVNGESITVSMTYRGMSAQEAATAGAAGAVSGVTMTVPGWTASGDGYVADLPAPIVGDSVEEAVEAYIHLSGEPIRSGSAYESQTLQPIGMLILKIESPM